MANIIDQSYDSRQYPQVLTKPLSSLSFVGNNSLKNSIEVSRTIEASQIYREPPERLNNKGISTAFLAMQPSRNITNYSEKKFRSVKSSIIDGR